MEPNIRLRREDNIQHVGLALRTGLKSVICSSLVLIALMAVSFLLTACTNLNAALLPDVAVEATATACRCQCYSYGSYPHTTPSSTPTPTGTWVPPTRTLRPTKTRPPVGCDYCTVPPASTPEPPHWPEPIVTCTARPDEPTLTAVPTQAAPIFPTLPPNTPLPAAIGDTAPISIGSMEGEALPGGIATHPITGRLYLIWSQLNTDPGQEYSGRVYLKLTDPTTGMWLPARTVNEPGTYKIGKAGPESAVAVARDGTIYVAYVKTVGDSAVLEWRSSRDNGQSWTAPQTLPYPGTGMVYNVRMLVDDQDQPHIAAIAKRGTDCGDETDGCGDIVYYERRPDGSWRTENRPVSGIGERQYNLAFNVFSLPDGNIRTVMGWREKHSAYTSYKDGSNGAWQPAHFIIDGDTHPYGIQDYWPGWTGMQMLHFQYEDQEWIYFFWSLYSTGRICYVYSSDGGVTWSGEDALAYNPIVSVPDPGAPFVPPTVWGGAYEPVPFWDAAHQSIFVVYRFRSRTTQNTSGDYFPAYAYGSPGQAGHDWVGYESDTTEPLRLFPPTLANTSRSFRGNDQHGAGSSPVYLLWVESTGSNELYFASVSPATLLSGTGAP